MLQRYHWVSSVRPVRLLLVFLYRTVMTFMASSPYWLMTFTATRPDSGLGNGREVSLRSVFQASSSISAFSVVLSDL